MTIDDRIKTIQACLKLAGESTATKGERENALQKALELQRKYRIQDSQLHVLDTDAAKEVTTDEPMSRGEFPCGIKRKPAHDAACSLLRAFFRVKVVTLDHKEPRWIVFLGRRSAVEMAKFIYDFILRSFDQAWEGYKRDFKQGLSCSQQEKKEFYHGLYLGQREKLLATMERIDPNKASPVWDWGLGKGAKSLMVRHQLAQIDKSEEQLLEEYFKRQFPGAKGGKPRTSKGMNKSNLDAGKNAGKNISIRKPLPVSKTTKPMALHS